MSACHKESVKLLRLIDKGNLDDYKKRENSGV